MLSSTTARIFKPCKTAMQSGRRFNKRRGGSWILEFPADSAAIPDPLMGWQSSSDTKKQVSIYFPDLASAKAYALARNIKFTVCQPKDRRIRTRGYADNFAFNRNEAWTH